MDLIRLLFCLCVTCTLRVFNLIVKNSTTLYILLAFVYVQLLCFNNEGEKKIRLEIVYLILFVCACVYVFEFYSSFSF